MAGGQQGSGGGRATDEIEYRIDPVTGQRIAEPYRTRGGDTLTPSSGPPGATGYNFQDLPSARPPPQPPQANPSRRSDPRSRPGDPNLNAFLATLPRTGPPAPTDPALRTPFSTYPPSQAATGPAQTETRRQIPTGPAQTVTQRQTTADDVDPEEEDEAAEAAVSPDDPNDPDYDGEEIEVEDATGNQVLGVTTRMVKEDRIVRQTTGRGGDDDGTTPEMEDEEPPVQGETAEEAKERVFRNRKRLNPGILWDPARVGQPDDRYLTIRIRERSEDDPNIFIIRPRKFNRAVDWNRRYFGTRRPATVAYLPEENDYIARAWRKELGRVDWTNFAQKFNAKFKGKIINGQGPRPERTKASLQTQRARVPAIQDMQRRLNNGEVLTEVEDDSSEDEPKGKGGDSTKKPPKRGRDEDDDDEGEAPQGGKKPTKKRKEEKKGGGKNTAQEVLRGKTAATSKKKKGRKAATTEVEDESSEEEPAEPRGKGGDSTKKPPKRRRDEDDDEGGGAPKGVTNITQTVLRGNTAAGTRNKTRKDATTTTTKTPAVGATTTQRNEGKGPPAKTRRVDTAAAGKTAPKVAAGDTLEKAEKPLKKPKLKADPKQAYQRPATRQTPAPVGIAEKVVNTVDSVIPGLATMRVTRAAAKRKRDEENERAL
ncbi:MAG: hypothetical protein M1816_001992 [Peltula sp. TS41687]|nr:MAG: hypothetical protein M1816_001992 [Peltula sp. TS41687]